MLVASLFARRREEDLLTSVRRFERHDELLEVPSDLIEENHVSGLEDFPRLLRGHSRVNHRSIHRHPHRNQRVARS